MHRVFCATAWELEGERRAFSDTVGEFNEAQAMGSGLLYIPVSLTNVRDKRPYQYVLEQNLRECRHCIVALTDGWGPPERNFERDYSLARQFAEDASLPMKDVALLLREGPGSRPEFAAELAAAGIRTQGFAGREEFQREVRKLLAAWLVVDRSEEQGAE